MPAGVTLGHLYSLALVSLLWAVAQGFQVATRPCRHRFSTIMSAAPKNTGRIRFITNKKCPFAQKVWICLEEYYGGSKGYDLVEVGLYGGSGKPQWFMDLNPKGQVPVLWLPTERAISESDVIIDYLTTLPPPKKADRNPLLPLDPSVMSKWRALTSPFVNSAKQAILRDDTSTLANLLYKFDRALPSAPSPFLTGPSFTAVDASLAPFFQRIAQTYPDVARESSPRLWEWYEGSIKGRDSFAATVVVGWWWWW